MRPAFVSASVLAVACGLVLTGCAAEPGSSETSTHDRIVMKADYPAYDGAAQAGANTDLAVKGTYTDSEVTLLHPTVDQSTDPLENPQAGATDVDLTDDAMSVVVTVSKIRVDEVIKGDVSVGDVIEVTQLGGEYEGTSYEEESTTLLPDTTSDVVLLLAETSEDGFDLINPEQGLLVASDSGSLEGVNGQEVFEGVSTVEELKEAIDQ